MITYYVVMGVCLLFVSSIERQTWEYPSVLEGMKYNSSAKLQYYLVVILLIWFSGLRTGFNDTWTYADNFAQFVQAGQIDLNSYKLTNYGGFNLFQQFLKTFVGKSGQVLIFTSAVVSNCMYMHYIVKNSENLMGSFTLFLIGLFPFSMGALKQMIAISFGLYAMDEFIQKRYLRATLLLVIGFSFHPYIICLVIAVMLKDQVWNIKTLLVIIGCVLAMSRLESILGVISDIGKGYTQTELTLGRINPFRVLVEAVPVGISFIYRDKINETRNQKLILGTNLNVIGFVFIAAGFFFNPMYMGRVAYYFTAMSMISVPMMLELAFTRNQRSIISGYYIFMVIYYLLDLTKLGTYSLFQDQFYRISFSHFIELLLQ